MSSLFFSFFFFKQKTAYEMRISDWSSDVCSSDLRIVRFARAVVPFGDNRAVLDDHRADGHFAPFGGDTGEIERAAHRFGEDRKSVVWGKRVSVSVDLGGRLIIKNTTIREQNVYTTYTEYS